MPSTEDTYRSAAKEHLGRAFELYESGSYFLSHYLSGLAVECHLRAYLRRVDSEFDAVDRQKQLRDVLRKKLGNDATDVGVILIYTPQELRSMQSA